MARSIASLLLAGLFTFAPDAARGAVTDSRSNFSRTVGVFALIDRSWGWNHKPPKTSRSTAKRCERFGPDAKVALGEKISWHGRCGSHSWKTWSLSSRGGDSFDSVSSTDEPRPERPSFAPAEPAESSYHLLWSRGVWKKTAISAMALFFLHFVTLTQFPMLWGVAVHPPGCLSGTSTGLAGAASQASALLLPLLSGACCAIQLILNAVAGLGCAGFNARLGPLRPYLASVLLYSTILSGQRSWGEQRIKMWAAGALASWFVALMPEMVHLWNGRASSERGGGGSKRSARDDADVRKDTMIAAPTGSTRVTLELVIPSMGCVACINKIDSSIRKLMIDSILDSSSWLTDDPKGGRAKVVFVTDSEQEARKYADSVVAAVSNSGFPCSINSFELQS